MRIALNILSALFAFSAGGAASESFKVEADRFADIQVLRYELPGFGELTLRQKQLAYYLYQAGLSGRDIFYDQKYKHNLAIRKTLEAILSSYSGSKESQRKQIGMALLP